MKLYTVTIEEKPSALKYKHPNVIIIIVVLLLLVVVVYYSNNNNSKWKNLT